MTRRIQIVIDVQVPNDWTGKEPLADAIEEFTASWVGGPDQPLPSQAVTAWWPREPYDR